MEKSVRFRSSQVKSSQVKQTKNAVLLSFVRLLSSLWSRCEWCHLHDRLPWIFLSNEQLVFFDRTEVTSIFFPNTLLQSLCPHNTAKHGKVRACHLINVTPSTYPHHSFIRRRNAGSVFRFLPLLVWLMFTWTRELHALPPSPAQGDLLTHIYNSSHLLKARVNQYRRSIFFFFF